MPLSICKKTAFFSLIATTILYLILTLHFYKTDSHDRPAFLYKVITQEIVTASAEKNYLVLSDFDKEFIHLATLDQVPKIIQKFFPKQSIFIIKIDASKLPGELVFEKNSGGETKYYHLYNGAIPKDAIIKGAENFLSL